MKDKQKNIVVGLGTILSYEPNNLPKDFNVKKPMEIIKEILTHIPNSILINEIIRRELGFLTEISEDFNLPPDIPKLDYLGLFLIKH